MTIRHELCVIRHERGKDIFYQDGSSGFTNLDRYTSHKLDHGCRQGNELWVSGKERKREGLRDIINGH